MAAQGRPIRMYGEPSGLRAPDWAWVQRRLDEAPLYWVVAASTGWPHPRPVWGVWHASSLCLSLGSPALRRSIAADGRVTVHLESATDVVVVEGRSVAVEEGDAAVARYDDKYDYAYDVARYGPLLAVAPMKVLAWTTAGFAGRDGFRSAGTWVFEDEL